MSKAYDRVEWNFLEAMLSKLGFASRWIQLIMKCVTTVSYSIIVNGPISPYLFLLCTEGLSSIIEHSKHTGTLKEVKASRQGPNVTHLFFADDSLLFATASQTECEKMKNLLTLYEKCSGQKVNFDKSALFFSGNATKDEKRKVQNTFRVQASTNPEKYLGLPCIVGRAKKKAFNQLKDRVQSRIQHWSSKWLSMGGKEIFIKAILQSIPVYAMNCFMFPINLCEELNKIISRYWLKNGNSRGIHWVAWRKMCLPKQLGGLGFREFEYFNVALLGKQAWRLMHDSTSLSYKVLSAKYFPEGNFLNGRLGSNPSFTWRSIFDSRAVVMAGMQWRIGNGHHIRVWKDAWLKPNFYLQQKTGRLVEDEDMVVASLIDSSSQQWCLDSLYYWFDDDVVQQILLIHLGKKARHDRIIWGIEKEGNYTVRNAYRMFVNADAVKRGLADPETREEATRVGWNRIWNAFVPPKIKVHIWRMKQNALPVLANLQRRGVVQSTNCPKCNATIETIFHALLSCPKASAVWNRMVLLRPLVFGVETLDDWFKKLTACNNLEVVNLACVTMWVLWTNRNAIVHERVERDVYNLISFIHGYIAEFQGVYSNKLPTRQTATATPWKPPPTSTVKANFDAAYNHTTHTGDLE